MAQNRGQRLGFPRHHAFDGVLGIFVRFSLGKSIWVRRINFTNSVIVL